jgi:hypothetical protein
MGFSKYIKTAFVAAGFLATANVSAALTEFDYDTFNASPNSTEIVLSKNGVTLSVTGYKWGSDSSGYVAANIITNINGLGVVGGAGGANRVGNSNSNSFGDYLLFEVDAPFNAINIFNTINIFFADRQGSDLGSDEIAGIDVGFMNGDIFTADASVHGAALSFSINGITGTTFAVKAMGAGNGFKIDRVAIDVPEPSILALLGLGIMGIASLRFIKS